MLVAGVVTFALSGGGSEQEVGPPAPDLVLAGFDGGQVALADFRGTPLVVNFWASWCTPCLAELPGFERVYQEHKGRVAFLGINLADDPTGAELVRQRTGITYPLAVDPDGAAFKAFGGFGMPTTVFISEDGRVIELYTGTLTADALVERIGRYFGRA